MMSITHSSIVYHNH